MSHHISPADPDLSSEGWAPAGGTGPCLNSPSSPAPGVPHPPAETCPRERDRRPLGTPPSLGPLWAGRGQHAAR